MAELLILINMLQAGVGGREYSLHRIAFDNQITSLLESVLVVILAAAGEEKGETANVWGSWMRFFRK